MSRWQAHPWTRRTSVAFFAAGVALAVVWEVLR